MRLGTFLHKDEEFAIDFTYNVKKLLLTVVTLVSPLIMALYRAGHYIFALWFLSISYLLSFFHRLISAAEDWMSTILPHMMWH